MRCLACCTAESYQLDDLGEFFKTQNYQVQRFRNVIHIQNTACTEDVFFFQHGCIVTWGLSQVQEQNFLLQLKHFSLNRLSQRECHSFLYQLGNATTLVANSKFEEDIITLESKEADNTLLKLALSYGFSQSVKLRSHEISIQKTVSANQPITEELARRGGISLSRKAIFKRIGEIFLARSSVNLSNEYLDVSEFFWRYPHLESYYLMVEKFLDIQKRVAILNQRLDVIHDIVLMLNNQLEHRYSSTLEIIIILLILGEILINIVYHYFKG
jgi:uncharacterized Rmd1/YagE family protein